MTIKVDRKLIWAQNAIETVYVHNKRGSAVAPGDVVILDTADSTAVEIAIDVTTVADDKAVFGMVLENIGINNYGLVQTKGTTDLLKADGTTPIAEGDYLSAYGTETYAQQATSGKGGVFAIALEALGSGTGVIDAYLIGGAGRFDTSSLSATYASPTITGALSISATTTFTSTGVVTMDGSASATDALTLTLGDILLSDGHLDIIEVDGTTNVFKIDHNGGVIASDNALIYLDDGGNIASGGNMLRLVPTGTPNAASILFEIVGAGKIGQAMYVDGDPTGIDLVHLLSGGDITNGIAVLGISNDGNLQTGGALLNLTLGGTPNSAARVFEIDGGSKDSIAMYIDSDAATESAIQITGAGNVANDKAMLHVTNTSVTAVSGASLLRLDGAFKTASGTTYGMTINMAGTTCEALWVEAGTSKFDELIQMTGTAKIEFLDNGLYIYSSTDGVLDIVADTTLALSGAVTSAGSITANNTDVSTSVTTGSVIVKGGIGVAKNSFFGGDLSIATAKKITTVAELTLNSVDPLTIQIGGVDWLQMDEVAISSFAAQSDVAGHAVYFETEDAGGSAAAAGKAGGLYNFKTGEGASAGGAGNDTGGAGGALSVITGGGAAGGTTNGVGGAGGALAITGGAGAVGAGSGTSGAGGIITLTAGAGNQASGGTAIGGAGGDIVLAAGALGAANGGTAGRSGAVNILGELNILIIGSAATDRPGTTVGTDWIGIKSTGTAPTGTNADMGFLYADFESDDDELFWLSGTIGTATQLTT